MKTKQKSTAKASAASKKGKAPAAKTVTKTAPKKKSAGKNGNWNLRLYVAGQTPRSLTAFANLKRLCEEHLQDRYDIEVIDLLKEPKRAQSDQIVAIPTLVRKLPEPIKRIIGDLSNTEKVLVGMDIQATGTPAYQ